MKRATTRANLYKDIAIFVFLLAIFGYLIIFFLAPSDAHLPYLTFIFISFLAALIGFMGHTQLCLILSSVLTSAWVGYKLYNVLVSGTSLALTDYFLIPLPLLTAGSLFLYAYSLRNLESENVMLRRQVDELVLVDELTGLYNLRSLYRDIDTMRHYCNRNNLPISLLIIKLRYEQELRSMLSVRRYDELRQRLAQLVEDSVRVEDKTYAIDDHGSLAVLATTDEEGLIPIRRRILNVVGQDGAFEGILDDNIAVALRIAGKQYPENMEPMAFKEMVEGELVYDV